MILEIRYEARRVIEEEPGRIMIDMGDTGDGRQSPTIFLQTRGGPGTDGLSTSIKVVKIGSKGGITVR